MRRVPGQKRRRRLVRDDPVIRGVEHLKAEAVFLEAKIDDLREVADIDVAPGIPLARAGRPSRRKLLIVSGLDDNANPKRVNVGAGAGSKGSSDLFANELERP